MEDINPTEEQTSIIERAQDSGNLQIVAYAGAGKSETLSMIDDALGAKARLYLAFNSKVVENMTKFNHKTGKPKVRSTTDCRTINSLGHRIWANTISNKIVINKKKTLELFRDYASQRSKDVQSVLWESYDDIKTAVDMAKAVGFIPEGAHNWEKRLVSEDEFFDLLEEGLNPVTAAAVDTILRASIDLAYKGNLDFNDQLYMPTLFGGAFPKYPVVMVDEAQDLSPINHAMVRKLIKGNARLIAVGDPYQSIYAFRGAMIDGMARQLVAHEMDTRRLSVSFRCPTAIVENARWRAPGFKALRHGGTVRTLTSLATGEIPEDSAILCRNNAPLFRCAIRLLSAGRSISMAGTDIGPKLLGVLRRFGDVGLPRSAVLGCIDSWEAARPDSPSAADTAECLRVFANLGSTLGEAIVHAESLFKQNGHIHLSTGHKAKGLEWPSVYHLDPWRLKGSDQDLNLKYVIQTRASETYTEIDLDGVY
jgi:superfamily I DNA/RNA helicase